MLTLGLMFDEAEHPNTVDVHFVMANEPYTEREARIARLIFRGVKMVKEELQRELKDEGIRLDANKLEPHAVKMLTGK